MQTNPAIEQNKKH